MRWSRCPPSLFVVAAILVALTVAPAAAQQRLILRVSDSAGTDTGDCSSDPCKTIQYAIDQIPFGSRGIINIAPGIYSEPPGASIVASVYYHRTVWIQGPVDDEKKCLDGERPTIRLTKNRSTAFSSQDFAIAGIRCVRIEEAPGVKGGVAFAGRQHAIVDYGDADIAVSGSAVTLEELSVASCVGPLTVLSDMISFAFVSYGSKLNMGCRHALPAAVTFSAYFVGAIYYSVIDAGVATFSGAGAAESTGQQCIATRAEILIPTPPQRLPGNAPCSITP